MKQTISPMPQIISPLSEKGGVGKTTTVLEYAAHLGWTYNKKCLVIDSDPTGTCGKVLLGNRPIKKTLFDLLTSPKETQIKDVVYEASPFWKNTWVVPSDPKMVSIESYFSGELDRNFLFKNAFQPVFGLFDCIFLDVPPILPLLTINALTMSTGYILVTDTCLYSLDCANRVHTLANKIKEHLNPQLTFLGVLITAFQTKQSHSVREFLERVTSVIGENPLDDFRIPYSTQVLKSQFREGPLLKFGPNNTVVKAYAKVIEKTLNPGGLQ